VDGVLIVNKPQGWTSHDVVARVRRIAAEKSIGHLGTLDPMATGVLPLVLGKFTRLAQFYNNADKRYTGIIRFGIATDTYDAEGEPVGPEQAVTFTREQLDATAKTFTGLIHQMPPRFSAKKIDGTPAYKLARKGEEVELKPKEVEVKELVITAWDGTRASFSSWVSSGTYLRALAHDMGKALGAGAHLCQLTRTAVREFVLDDAHSLEDLEIAAQAGSLEDSCLHQRLVLPEFPAVTSPLGSIARLRNGGAVNLPEFCKATTVRVFGGQRELIAIAKRVAGTLFQPKVVLNANRD
jgi:tRNA pseudouridine55 synthase